MKKLLIIHGWNFKNYTKFGCHDAWENRRDFVEKLEKDFNVIRFNLPGFCAEKDPSRPWTIDDFSDFVDRKIKSIGEVDAILGYSFGCAIAVQWKYVTKSATPLVLISPAIIRRYTVGGISNSTKRIRAFLPGFVTNFFRYLYMQYKGNEYYIHATPVMRKTYRNIVGLDQSEKIKTMAPHEIGFVFGEKDTATPPELLMERLPKEYHGRIKIVSGGGHDIATTNTEELINSIVQLLN